MFLCRLDDVFGVGDTPLEAFHSLEESLIESGELDIGEDLDPHHCQFFEEIPVTISSKTTWNIEADSPEFDD